MKIDVIIPNYNGSQLIQKNIEPVLVALKKYDARIIIVDDCSVDSEFAALQEIVKNVSTGNQTRITVLRNNTNKGFSSTVNRGVKEGSGEILVLLNTDVKPEKDFLESVIPHFEDPHMFAVGCMDRSIENGKEVLRGRGIGKWKRGILAHSRGEVDKSDTLWVSGGSGIFRRSIWETLGGLNELYSPFYWEDIDLSYRALKAGYRIVFEKKSVVIHEHEEGAIKKTRSVSEVKKISYRNQFTFVWLNASDPQLLLSHILWLPYHIVNSVRKKEWTLIDGLFNAVIQLPTILKSRASIQKKRKVSDRAVMRRIV